MATPRYFNYLALRASHCEMNTLHAFIPSWALLNTWSFKSSWTFEIYEQKSYQRQQISDNQGNGKFLRKTPSVLLK